MADDRSGDDTREPAGEADLLAARYGRGAGRDAARRAVAAADATARTGRTEAQQADAAAALDAALAGAPEMLARRYRPRS